MRKTESDFLPLRKIIRRLIQDLRNEDGAELRMEIERVWRVAAGELAAVTRVRSVRKGRVVIESENSSVLAEARQFCADRFLSGLREAGLSGIERVVFELAESQQEADG